MKKIYQILLIVLFVFVISASAAAHEDVYTEIVSVRAGFKGSSSADVAPNWPVFPSTSAVQIVDTHAGAIIADADGNLFLGQSFAPILVTGGNPAAGGRLVVDSSNGQVVAAVASGALYEVHCKLETSSKSCDFMHRLDLNVGAIRDVASMPGVGNAAIWIAGEKGLFFASNMTTVSSIVTGEPMNAVALSAKEVVAGNSVKLYRIDPSSNQVLRFEWVTQIDQGWGGVIDDNITSLAFGPSLSEGSSSLMDLFIGNPTCLNLHSATSGFYSRIAANQGLPVANITSVAAGSYKGQPQIWIGSLYGISLWQPSVPGSSTASGGDPAFHYMRGARYLVGDIVRQVATTDGGATAVVLTDKGVNFLTQKEFTLSDKAKLYEQLLVERHNRHGMTAECYMTSFGDLRTCYGTNNDNNGLWTSLVVAAEYMRYHVTQEAEALQTASSFFEGLVLLNNVTGKKGLMARSCCSPEEHAKHTCGPTSAVEQAKGLNNLDQWHNSTNPAYKGWVWKGDTSSDEVDGQIFGLATVAQLSPIANERAVATDLIINIVAGIIANGFELIDVTGNATTWGKWSPHFLNDYRAWSDGRGVNSMEILAFLAAANNVSSSQAPLWSQAYNELTNATNQYNDNILNLKIIAPCDDNYSDDELTFLPFFTFLTSCIDSSTCSFKRDTVLAALERTWNIVRPERPDLWNSIYLAVTGKHHDSNYQEAIDDIIWNLRTWPIELIDWPVNNTARIDIIYEAGINRSGRTHEDSSKLFPPLPANERNTLRWNGNPYAINPSGSGTSEMDPGAWLLPYWMARYYGIVQ